MIDPGGLRARWHRYWEEHGDEPVFQTDDPLKFLAFIMAFSFGVSALMGVILLLLIVGCSVLVRGVSGS